MKIAGIVTEYNPFHNGHVYHIQKTREISNCDVLIAVMSGNFVQRGEPAIVDKWERANAALQHGVDIVLELPFPYVMQSADHFAYGAIEILKLAGVTHIVFGSEQNNIEQLAQQMDVDQQQIQSIQKEGHSLAYAHGQASTQLSSNDILGVAYLKALKNTNIQVSTIQRTNQYHDKQIHNEIASATAIRHAILEGKEYQHASVMKNILNPHYIQQYYPFIQTLLMTMQRSYLKEIFLMDEGIEQLLIKQASLHDDFDSFLNACVSKRYTKSRIQRTLMHLLCQTTKTEIDELENISYIRVLGFNETGKNYLANLRNTDIQIASKFNQIPLAYRQIEYRSCAAYAYPLSLSQRKRAMQNELQAPVYVK